MSAAFRRDTLALGQCEWDAESTGGVSLSGGPAWWGLAVRYRRLGERKWQRFHLVDVHSWDAAAIHAAIEGHIRLNGTLR